MPDLPRGEILTPAQISNGFRNGTLFRKSAFRLEQLAEYDSPEDRAALRLWLAGEPQGEAARAYWDRVITDARHRGATMSRVHALPAAPLNDYLRFELDFYRGSATAGEDIRLLPHDQAAGADLGPCDYWLFDDDRVVIQYYGHRGAWLHGELVTDPVFAAACRLRRDTAMSRAIPLNDYLTRSAA